MIFFINIFFKASSLTSTIKVPSFAIDIFPDSSYEVYGKTGTAELDKNNNVNSWFVGYAKKGKKQLAIAVVYENIKDGTISAKESANSKL